MPSPIDNMKLEGIVNAAVADATGQEQPPNPFGVAYDSLGIADVISRKVKEHFTKK